VFTEVLLSQTNADTDVCKYDDFFGGTTRPTSLRRRTRGGVVLLLEELKEKVSDVQGPQ
jgi:hypothetical protein